MSKLRPECGNSKRDALPNETAIFLIRDAVARRRSLIHGRLHDEHGHHCAMGAFWTDNPEAVVHTSLVDEVAAVNDSMRTATPRERWRKVQSWLRWKMRVMAHEADHAR